MKTLLSWRAKLSVVGLALAVVVVMAVLLALVGQVAVPPWEGRGDWSSCSAIAHVKPEDAIRAAAASRGFSSEELRTKEISVSPVYINESGYGFEVLCNGDPALGQPLGRLGSPVDGAAHFGWSVAMAETEAGTSFCSYYDYVDWQTGAPFLSVTPC